MVKYLFTTLFVFTLVFTGGLGTAFADHGGTDVDCENFDTGEEVMDFWVEHGYSAENDPMDLDRGESELPCESLTEGLNPADYASGSEADETEVTEESTDTESTTETNEDSEEAVTSSEEESDEDSSVSGDAESDEAAEEGGELADTATSTPAMLALGFGLLAVGGIFLARRKFIG